HGDRVEEDDLDVEEDEEHRDQVEADPEAEPALDLGGEPALVRVALAAPRLSGPEPRVDQREYGAYGQPQADEDDRWEIRTQDHRRRGYTTGKAACDTLLLSAV